MKALSRFTLSVIVVIISLAYSCGGNEGDGGDGHKTCVDLDGDGYGAYCAGGADCNDSIYSVHPGAPELGCDAVDNNCNGTIDEVVRVNFPDANLGVAVGTAVAKAPNAILNTDFCNLTILTATGIGISDLSGLEYASELTELALFGNFISDLASLSGLVKLTNLSLNLNQISDISALSDLSALASLTLSWNLIENISPISELNDISTLHLVDNQISDISALSGLTNLTDLNLEKNQITDISALSGLTNLIALGIHNNQIIDISTLSVLANLSMLWLNGNQIEDISVLIGLPWSGGADILLIDNNFLDNGDCSNINTLKAKVENLTYSPQQSGALTCP